MSNPSRTIQRIAGVLLANTIIGIPLAVGSFKIIPITLAPLGVRIVRTDGRPAS